MSNIDIQSVVYRNAFADIRSAVESTANSASFAMRSGRIDGWSLLLGDCGESVFAPDDQVAELRAIVQEGGGEFESTFFGANLGSAAGHNALAKLGSSELMIILNPDAQMAFDTIANLVGGHSTDVGIVEARQLPIEHPKYYTPGTGDTSWASTACALTSRAAFDEVGGFDAETFFLYCDDVDYSWRLKLAGYRVVYEPSARLFHDKRLTVDGDWPASEAEVYYSAEAALMIAHKYSRPDLVKAIAEGFERDGSGSQRRAAEAFAGRQRDGRLPIPVDEKHSVAQFVSGNYAKHRF